MKVRFISLFVVGAGLLFSLSACSNSEAEAEISRLKQENESLRMNVKNVRATLDSITSMTDSIYKDLSDLDMNPNP